MKSMRILNAVVFGLAAGLFGYFAVKGGIDLQAAQAIGNEASNEIAKIAFACTGLLSSAAVTGINIDAACKDEYEI